MNTNFILKQVKTFINKKENPDFVPKSSKTQYLRVFDNARKIEANDIKRILHDTEYLASLSDIVKIQLKKQWADFQEMTYTPFNKKGITESDALEMCKLHDAIIKSKKKHPLTLDQVKQNEEKAKLAKPTEKTALNDEKLI